MKSSIKSWVFFSLMLGLAVVIIFVGRGSKQAQVHAKPKISFVPALTHVFDRPIALTHPPMTSAGVHVLDGAFIAEQGGRILRVVGGRVEELINMSAEVHTRHNEEGLLGLTHAPRFPHDPRLFIYYSASEPRRTVVAELRLSKDLQHVEKLTPLLQIPQPYGNHNGGALVIGPDDHLYVAVGDGGAAGDPQNNAQNLSTHLGSILRLDISQPQRVTLPADNPFQHLKHARPEIWAYGLRNPWRMSFDRIRGDLWVGDVGQNRYEEVHIVRRGDNLGWKWREGRSDYRDRHALNHRKVDKKMRAQWVEPVAVYDHEQGISITGGYVYRGSKSTAHQGLYVYADFVTGRVWGLDAERTTAQRRDVSPKLLAQVQLNIASFAEDRQGELYAICFDGTIYRLQWRP
jgi:glucose/arabinose dehydrogenase